MRHIQLLIFALCLGFFTNASAQKTRKKKAQPQPVAISKEDAAAKKLAEKLPFTEKILVVDSIVTDMNADLTLPRHLGTLTSYGKAFGKESPDTWRAYVNDFRDYCVFSRPDSTGHMRLYTTHLIGKTWSTPQRIKDFDALFTDITCPYMSEDGTTLYFAGKSEDGLGGYDIYRSNYDTEEKIYMEPQSLGLPFNSTGNDYYCITSESDSLTWLVTDRRQPEGKACVYLCVTEQPRLDYTSDHLTHDQLLALAELRHIKDTWSLWKDKSGRQHAIARLENIKGKQSEGEEQIEPFFINDRVSYTSSSQFRSNASRQLYGQWLQMQQESKRKKAQLETLRSQYEAASASGKKNLSADILKTERQVEQLDITIAQTEKRIRNNENQSLK